MGGVGESPFRFFRIDVPIGFTQLLHMEVGCERCPILAHVCPFGSVCAEESLPSIMSKIVVASLVLIILLHDIHLTSGKQGWLILSVNAFLTYRIYLSTFVWKLNEK